MWMANWGGGIPQCVGGESWGHTWRVESFSKQIWAVWVGGPLGFLDFFFFFWGREKGRGIFFSFHLRVFLQGGKVFWGKGRKRGEIFTVDARGGLLGSEKSRLCLSLRSGFLEENHLRGANSPRDPEPPSHGLKPAGQGSSQSRRAKGGGGGPGGTSLHWGRLSGGGRVLNT